MISPVFKKWINDMCGHAINNNNIDIATSILVQQAKKSQLSTEIFSQKLMRGLINPQNFIDAITTHESYFFRHLKTMEHIVDDLIPQWLQQGIKPRVLSAPCAQGEEPYSLAMLLAEKNIGANRVSINGIDIADASIKAAKNAQYSAYMLRKTPEHIKQKYFKHIKKSTLQGFGEFAINDVVKAYNPQFYKANLLQGLPSELAGNFHVIFCQNVLIYFNAQDQQKLLKLLYERLEPDGWLFVDVTEVSIVSQMFERKGSFHISGFQRKDFENRNKHAANARITSANNTAQTYGVAKKPLSHVSNKMVKPPIVNKPVVKKTVAIKPKQVDYFSQAQEAYANKQLVHAIELFEHAIEQCHLQGTINKAQVYLGLAKAQADHEDNFSAMESAEQALNLCDELNNNEQAEVHGILGIIKKNRGLRDAANEHFDQIKILDPKSPLIRLKAY